MASTKAARRKAAKKARAAWKGFTPEGLERLRAAAREGRAWEKSTGPRTAAGKARSRRNAIRDGFKADAATLPPLLALLLTQLRAAEAGGPLPSHDLVTAAMADVNQDASLPDGIRIRAGEIRSWWHRLFFKEFGRLAALHRAGLLPDW